MTHRLSPLLLVLVWPAFACGAGSTPVEVWSSPTIDRLELADSHALQPVLNAWLTSDCTGVIERSVALRGWISEAVADAFHPAQGGPPSAAQMRSALSEYVYATPPVVEIGEHGFRFPSWWTAVHAYCLVDADRYGEAGALYTDVLRERFSADAAWRLALVEYWGGNAEEALALLEAWPAAADIPDGYSSVIERMRDRDEVPFILDGHQ